MDNEGAGLDPLFVTFDQLMTMLVDYLPTLASAGALLAAGFAIAWVLKVLVLRISAAVSSLFSRTTGTGQSRHVRLPWPLSVIIANLIFGLTVIFFLAVSARVLGLPGVADWIEAAAAYLPVLLVAAAIVLGGYIAASIARDSIARYNERAGALANLVFALLNAIAGLAALRHLGIDLVLVRALFIIVAAAVFGSMAFAFATGASGSLANIIAAYYVRRVYRQGQRVRIAGLEGEILEITPTAVVIDTPLGRAMIPATKFNQESSILLGREEVDDAA